MLTLCNLYGLLLFWLQTDYISSTRFPLLMSPDRRFDGCHYSEAYIISQDYASRWNDFWTYVLLWLWRSTAPIRSHRRSWRVSEWPCNGYLQVNRWVCESEYPSRGSQQSLHYLLTSGIQSENRSARPRYHQLANFSYKKKFQLVSSIVSTRDRL